MSRNLKLCIFPNDPIKAYYDKGEIKERYYNPENFFDEVHIISFSENEVEESLVQTIAGEANLKIHPVGGISIKDRTKNTERITNLVRTINPDVIRAYNPRLEGWFAASCSKQLKIPFFLSLHTQFDYNRKLMKKLNFKKYLALKYTEKFIEPYVLKNANKITIVFRVIEPYVLKHTGKVPELLYNRINLEQFSNGIPLERLPSPLIISVGSLIKEKNHECIINSMKDLDSHCLIIGNGKQYAHLMKLIKKEKLENKVTIKKSVMHNEIQNYYKSATVFALAYDPQLEGLPIPVMEAMAAGLPVVIPYPSENYSDGLEDIAIFSVRNSNSFGENIRKVLQNPNLHKKFSHKSHEKAKYFESGKIEKREAEIYSELVQK